MLLFFKVREFVSMLALLVDHSCACTGGCLFALVTDHHNTSTEKRQTPNPSIAQIRHRIARGNVVLALTTTGGQRLMCCPLFALKKFSGGMGDEDEDQVVCGWEASSRAWSA